MKRCRASALQRSTVRQPSQRRSALLNRAAELEATSLYPSTRSRRLVSAAAACPDMNAAPGIATTSMTDVVALVSREVLKQLRDECAPAPLPHEHALHGYVPVASQVTLPRYGALASDPLNSAVTGALNSLFPDDTGNGNMTVDTLPPTAPQTTATNITALAPMMTTLLNAALSCGTKRTYHRAISSYANFCKNTFPGVPVFPASACVLGAFIAHLHSQRYAPATLMTYMSAISYVHKLAGNIDPTQLFVIKKLLVGAQKLSATPDTRLPISLSILRKIVDATQFIASSAYLRLLLQSMFLLAFHAFLRIGEITVHSRHNNGRSIIKFSDVTIGNTGIALVMSHFKHNTSKQPVTLTNSQTSDAYCPVHALSQFLKLRGTFDGPLFAFANSSPVSRTYFCQYLTKALKWAGLDPTKYKAHSFRIGAATTGVDRWGTGGTRPPTFQGGGTA